MVSKLQLSLRGKKANKQMSTLVLLQSTVELNALHITTAGLMYNTVPIDTDASAPVLLDKNRQSFE